MESKNFVADECSKPSHIKYLKSRGGGISEKDRSGIGKAREASAVAGVPRVVL